MVGIYTPCGAVSTREIIVIFPALLELYRFEGFLNRGWDLIPSRWGGAVELEPISDFSQRDWGFDTVRGGVGPKEVGFLPRFVLILEINNYLRTGDGTLSSPGGADSVHTTPSQ